VQTFGWRREAVVEAMSIAATELSLAGGILRCSRPMWQRTCSDDVMDNIQLIRLIQAFYLLLTCQQTSETSHPPFHRAGYKKIKGDV